MSRRSLIATVLFVSCASAQAGSEQAPSAATGQPGSQAAWRLDGAPGGTVSSPAGAPALPADASVVDAGDTEGGLSAGGQGAQPRVPAQPAASNVEAASPVPEPAMVAMIMAALALFGVGGLRRRQAPFSHGEGDAGNGPGSR